MSVREQLSESVQLDGLQGIEVYDCDVVAIDPGVAHMTRNGRHALVHKPSGQWVMLNDDAYGLIVRCDGAPFEEFRRVARELHGLDARRSLNLVKFLASKSIVTIGAGKPEASAPAAADTMTAILSITNRCNLSCPMCCADSMGFDDVDPDELSHDDVVEVLRKLSEGGVGILYVSGGEPMARSDVMQILEAARPLFGWIVLQTNGMLIGAEAAAKLGGLIDRAAISLDGWNAEIHDSIRGRGSFDATVAAIGRLRREGVPVRIAHMVTKLSIGRTGEMRALAESLEAELSLGAFTSIGRGRDVVDRFAVSYEEIVSQVMADGANVDDPMALRACAYDHCPAGRNVIHIAPNGVVYPCAALRADEFAIGSLLAAESFESLMRRSNPVVREVFSRTVDEIPGCRECDVRYFCNGMCMGEAYCTKGSIWERDPRCEIVYRRMARLLWGDDHACVDGCDSPACARQ